MTQPNWERNLISEFWYLFQECRARDKHSNDCRCMCKEGINLISFIQKSIQQAREEAREPYHELILAVGNKYEGETRHETALRYIRQAEQGTSEAKDVATTPNTEI